jgi:hypothetical protein
VPASIYLVFNCIEDGYLPWSQRLGYIFQTTERQSLQWKYEDFSIDVKWNDMEDRYSTFRLVKVWLEKKSAENRFKIIRILEDTCDVKPLRGQMLTWKDVLEMKDNGCCFGAHTLTHPVLKNLAVGEAVDEMKECRAKIEARLNADVDHFAFPAGSYSEELLRIVPSVYKTCFVRADDFNYKIYSGNDPYALVRLGIANEPYYVIISEVAGLYNFFRKLFN